MFVLVESSEVLEKRGHQLGECDGVGAQREELERELKDERDNRVLEGACVQMRLGDLGERGTRVEGMRKGDFREGLILLIKRSGYNFIRIGCKYSICPIVP